MKIFLIHWCITIISTIRVYINQETRIIEKNVSVLFFENFKKILLIYFFRERGREGGREGEKLQCVRDTWLPLTHHQLGTRPATQACALTGN